MPFAAKKRKRNDAMAKEKKPYTEPVLEARERLADITEQVQPTVLTP